MHKKLADEGINVLKNFDEINKIILYGSVHNGDYKPSSDIDLACIIDDSFKLFPLDLEGLPMGLRQKVNNTLNVLKSKYDVAFDAPIYWNSEFEQGIMLDSGRAPPSRLDDVGSVKYFRD